MTPHWYQPKRLASSVWVPWALGLVTLLTLAVVTQLYGGKIDEGLVVPTAVLDAQQATTDTAAQQVRRGLNAGLSDVVQLAGGLTLAGGAKEFGTQLTDFTKRFHRYRAVYVLDAGRRVVAKAGGGPHLNLVPAKPADSGMTGAALADDIPVVVQYAHLKLSGNRAFLLVAEYDVAHLRFSLSAARPATVWVVDKSGKVVASTAGFTAFQQLDEAVLRRAASAAHSDSGVLQSGGSQAAKDVVAYSPVHGDGEATDLAWGVVTSRSVDTVSLPQTQAKRQATLFAILLAALALGAFGWMLLMFLIPLRKLTREAERLAAGDLDEPVEVRRMDEIGLVGRSLERVRVRMIKASATPPPPAQRDPLPPAPVSPVAAGTQELPLVRPPGERYEKTFPTAGRRW